MEMRLGRRSPDQRRENGLVPPAGCGRWALIPPDSRSDSAAGI